MLIQGIKIIGTLANIKSIEAKEFDGRITPAHQKLQVTVLDGGGLSIIDIKDVDFVYKKESVGKSIDVSVAYSVVNNNAYFRLV